MNQDDRDRLELLVDDAGRALEQARALCRHALGGEPGEYERLENLAASAAALWLVAASLGHTPPPALRPGYAPGARRLGDAFDAIGESLRVR